MKETGIRHARLEELLLEEMETIIPFRMNDPRIVGCQVTRVQLNPDLKSCRVFIVPTGQDEKVADILKILTHAVSFIRGCVSENLALKFTPTLEFLHDQAYEKAQRVEQIFAQLHHAPADDGTSGGGEES